MTKKSFYFYIGTEAELLKLLPVLLEFEKRKVSYKLIFSGQNKTTDSHLLELIKKKEPDILITKKQLKQSVLSLFTWFIWSFYRTWYALSRENKISTGQKILIVQGDTLSTVLGSIVGKLRGYKIAHVESGYRSHNWLQPFPEEIDRVIVSFFADYHFYPSKDLLPNIEKRRGKKICTYFNTNIDCLELALSHKSKLSEKIGQKYFIFIMHRQENILNKKLVLETLRAIDDISRNIQCIFIKHSYTDEMVGDYNFRGQVKTIKKLPFLDFISLLKNSEFIMTDGGGNQQESYYLGKPCLILRNVTEGREGLGENAVISKLKTKAIYDFYKSYKKYIRPRIVPKTSPSQIIVDELLK